MPERPGTTGRPPYPIDGQTPGQLKDGHHMAQERHKAALDRHGNVAKALEDVRLDLLLDLLALHTASASRAQEDRCDRAGSVQAAAESARNSGTGDAPTPSG